MGTYFNPNNESFRQVIRSMIYVDKTGLLNEMNKAIDTEQRCIALSHARRFGKTQVARMIDDITASVATPKKFSQSMRLQNRLILRNI